MWHIDWPYQVYVGQWPIFYGPAILLHILKTIWAASSEFVTYRLCEQRRFRRACASAQSRQNLRCSLIKAVSQEEPSDRKLDPWPRWMAGHAQLKFVMTECSKTQIRLARPIWWRNVVLGIMDQCHSKIDLVKYMWVSDLYFVVHWFCLISLS